MYLPEHDLVDASSAYPKPDRKLVYGTAGFRMQCVAMIDAGPIYCLAPVSVWASWLHYAASRSMAPQWA